MLILAILKRYLYSSRARIGIVTKATSSVSTRNSSYSKSFSNSALALSPNITG